VSTQPIDVGPCTPVDLPQLFGLALNTFGDSQRWSDQRVVQVLIADAVYVAREHGRPVGYVAIGRDADDEPIVEQLLVAPGHERRGIGHRLLECAESFANDAHAHTLRIACEEDNWRARDFYRRVGFQPVGREQLELPLPRQ
jgi:GNAT superfamily N-acetyltransferase